VNEPARTTRSLLRTLPLLVALSACAPATVEQMDAGAPLLPLWEVTDGAGTVYLLGSIHMLRPETYPLDDAIYAAFDESDVAAFEVHLDSLEAAAPQMLARGVYQDGRTLADVLPPELHADLEARLSDLGVPIQAMSSMKPWMMALTVSALTMQRSGYEAAEGVDMHFFERARSSGHRVIGFETMAEQIDVFDGMSLDAQVAFLRSTLEELDGFVDMMDEATELWQRGDAEEIAAMMTESMAGQPDLKRRLLDDRNQAWVPQIETLLRSRDKSIVIVGMAHLIGDGSVVDLLRDRGYSVTRRTAAAAR
jgi:uncharacterized protein